MKKLVFMGYFLFCGSVFGMVVSETDSEDIRQAHAFAELVRRSVQQERNFLNAAQTGDRARCQELLAQGVDRDATDQHNRTALHYACFFGFPDVIRLLLDSGAALNARDISGNTPLHYLLVDIDDLRAPLRKALMSIAIDMVKSRGADLRARNGRGITPLYMRGVRDFAFSELLHKTAPKKRRI